MTSPKRATELLTKGRFEPAMDALLAAWRAHRAPQLERAIASLSDVLTRSIDPIDEDEDDWQEQWDRRARARRPVELGVLLPFALHPPKGAIPGRVRALLRFGPDPRIGALLVEIIATPPLTASSNFPMWTELFAALPEYVDAHAREQLEARIATRGGKSNFWTKLEGWVKAAVPKLPEPARLPSGWKSELTELQRAIKALAKGPAIDLRVAATPEPSFATVEDLAAVRSAVEQGELADALDRVVAYWAGRRSPTVAALIDRLGMLVDEQQEPPAGKTAKARHEAWLQAAEHPSPHAIGPLLASLRDGKLDDVEARIEMMIGWQPDPRVARAMLLLIKDYMLGARDRLWKAVYEAVLHHADPRVAEEIRKRHDKLRNAHGLHRHISEGRELRRVFDGFVAAVEAAHELTSDQAEHAEAIAQRLAAQVEQQDADEGMERKLVEAIVAAWQDDGPRLVYSDWLQSRRDARGEFIALDVALAQGKKVKGAREKYFKANKDALVGPLAGVLNWGEKFERGFLDLARITSRKGGLDLGEDQRRELLADLRWALIRSLHVDDSDPRVTEIFEHAPLLALERLSQPSLVALQAFARREDSLPRLRELAIHGNVNDALEDWQRLDSLVRVLPGVESIEITIWDRGRVTPPLICFQTGLIRRAKELVCGDERTSGVSRVDEWLVRMVASECPVKGLRLVGPELVAEVTQTTLGRFEVALTLDRLGRPGRDFENVLASLRGLPRNNIERVKLTLGEVGDEVRPSIDAALAGVTVTS